jgi:hypothetical protein
MAVPGAVGVAVAPPPRHCAAPGRHLQNRRMQPYTAEFLGTLWLVLAGCGSAALAAGFPEVGIGLLGVSVAFGVAVLTMAFAIGRISGRSSAWRRAPCCHAQPRRLNRQPGLPIRIQKAYR